LKREALLKLLKILLSFLIGFEWASLAVELVRVLLYRKSCLHCC